MLKLAIMQSSFISEKPRKVIHIDMDCFYAAIEVRDNPNLKNLPVAVGGSVDKRGVLCTCNYEARKYGVRSAMPTATALKLCPDLVLLPVNMARYKIVSRRIQEIFNQYTNLVEPLALDEAFLDVSACLQYKGSATLIAEAIRKDIWHNEHLTASAGISSNKFLAKIASGWNKPNGIYVIKPEQINEFIVKLPVNKLFGVGQVTNAKLEKLNIHTCADLQKFSLNELVDYFGKFGAQLYYQSRGIDNREVNPNRQRKSLSVETTFATNLVDLEIIYDQIRQLSSQLRSRLEAAKVEAPIKAQFIKIKFSDFKQISAEINTNIINFDNFIGLFDRRYNKQIKPIRLLGVGVNFDYTLLINHQQQQLF